MAGLGIATADYILKESSGSPPIIAYDKYTVKAGDSLSLIAQRLFGDPMRWKEIWNINPQIVDPNVISVGQVINVPAAVIASSTDPVKTTLPGPRQTAVPAAAGGSFLNSPVFLIGSAGVALLIILMATRKTA